MTPRKLLDNLSRFSADLPLVFESDAGVIQAGYHVTEFKLARIHSIDCGARQSAWSEATLQLLDGGGGKYLRVGRFAAILSQSMARLDGLDQTPMQVEFAHGNKGLRLYTLGQPECDATQVTVRLTDTHAQCKPARLVRATADRATRLLPLHTRVTSGSEDTRRSTVRKSVCCGRSVANDSSCCR